MTLLRKIEKDGRAYTFVLTPWILVTHPRFPSYVVFALRFSEPVRTIWLWIALPRYQKAGFVEVVHVFVRNTALSLDVFT
jgi:hypothetical protein